MIKLKDLLRAIHFVNCFKKQVKIAYKCETFLWGYDDIEWLMDKQVGIIDIYHSVVLIRLKEEEIDDVFEI